MRSFVMALAAALCLAPPAVARDLALAGVVVGAWPDDPDLACRSNIGDLESLAAQPLAGVMRSGAGALPPPAFLLAARAGLGPSLGGDFDAADFRRALD